MLTRIMRKVLLPSARRFVIGSLVVAGSALAVQPAHAQGRDNLANGAAIGAVAGAGAGVAFTYAVRDSDLTVGQYARSALIFGAIGAGAGAGIDALFYRAAGPGVPPRRIRIAPTVWRDIAGVVVKWRW